MNHRKFKDLLKWNSYFVGYCLMNNRYPSTEVKSYGSIEVYPQLLYIESNAGIEIKFPYKLHFKSESRETDFVLFDINGKYISYLHDKLYEL